MDSQAFSAAATVAVNSSGIVYSTPGGVGFVGTNAMVAMNKSGVIKFVATTPLVDFFQPTSFVFDITDRLYYLNTQGPSGGAFVNSPIVRLTFQDDNDYLSSGEYIDIGIPPKDIKQPSALALNKDDTILYLGSGDTEAIIYKYVLILDYDSKICFIS